MTQYELLDLLVGALSSAAVVATLLYAAWESRATREQSALLSAQMLTEQLVTLDRVFIDRPELRPYFWDAQPLDGASPAIRAQALAVAELMLDVFQLALTGGGRFSARHREGIHAWIVRAFSRSPALRAKLLADRAMYGPAMIRLLAEAVPGSADAVAKPVRSAELGGDQLHTSNGDRHDP